MLTPIKPKDSKITSFLEQQNYIYFISQKGRLRIGLFSDDMFRVSYTEEEAFDSRQAEEFLQPPKEIKYDLIKAGEYFLISTKELVCRVNENTGALSFYRKSDGAENILFMENQKEPHHLEAFDSYISSGNIKTQENQTADGLKKTILASDKVFDKRLYHTRLDFVLEPDEKIFGLGQNESGLWDYRHTSQYLNQANKKIAIPSFVSSKGYGILFSSQSPCIFCGQENPYFYTTADFYLDYYFTAPAEKSDIVKAFRQVSGKALLPPKWAFGYVQSQERYESQKEILSIAKEFKKRKIPVSCLVLDWLSWDDGMWGQKSFDKKRFPDPAKMIDELAKDNVHFMISIWPSMDPKCQNYKEMQNAGKLLPGQNICNAFDKEARELYWKQTREGLAIHGIESWWCDSSEPITPEWGHLECPPEEIQFAEYLQTAADSMPLEKSNAYGYYHAMGMYQGQLKDYPDRRMLILTRSGITGSQKFGVTLWSGDTSASWKTLQNQLLAAINFSLSGIPYWTFDIGAFFVKKGINWYWNGDYDDTIQNKGYKELYVRWLQLGTFLPMFRAHGTDCRREPWAFASSDPADKNIFYKTIVQFIKLRYKLMPYIYSVAASVWKDDQQFIRPLFTQFRDKNCLEISGQFMFGPNLMVCPVVKALYYDKEGQPINAEKSIRVYLPQDCDWYDWWTGKSYKGGHWLECPAPLNIIPLFVKAGSVIPVEENNAIKTLRFPDSQGTCQPFDLYEDDGKTNDYLQGKFKLYKVF